MMTDKYSQPMRPVRPNHDRHKEQKTKSVFYTASGAPDSMSYNIPPNNPSQNSTQALQPMSTEEKVHGAMIDKFMKNNNIDDESLAHDLLAGKQWNYEQALAAFKSLNLDSDADTLDPLSVVQSTSSTSSNVSTYDASSTTRTGKGKEERLHRGLSTVIDNVDGMTVARMDIKPGQDVSMTHSDTTFLLPDFSAYTQDPTFIEYVEQDLIDFTTMNILERTGFMNWWAVQSPRKRLWPLHTKGDGNCLLHAASLAMWGYQDKTLELRMSLYKTLQKESQDGSLYRRWRWQQMQNNKEMMLELSEEEWHAEWTSLVKLSSAETRQSTYTDSRSGDTQSTDYYEFLEEFHVFVLAQILKRPIIVFADNVIRDVDGYPLAPVPFGGIYLPLLKDEKDCFKSPLMLAYDRCHFTAVVTQEHKSLKPHHNMKDLVPLTGHSSDLLPIHFFIDPGKSVDWNNLPEDKSSVADVIHLLEKYMNVYNIVRSDILSGSGDSSDSASDSSQTNLNHNQPKEPQKLKKHKIIANKVKSKLKGTKAKDASVPANSKSGAPVKRDNGADRLVISDKEDNETELEPDQDSVMCACLEIIKPPNYVPYVKEYLKKSREDYLSKKDKGLIEQLKKKPSIATKLSVNVNQESGRRSPSALSPIQPGTKLCVACKTYQGTPETDNLCSTCYKNLNPEMIQQKCYNKECDMYGSKDRKGYCSVCYNQIVELDDGKPKRESHSHQVAKHSEYSIPITHSPPGTPQMRYMNRQDTPATTDYNRLRISGHDARYPTQSTSYSYQTVPYNETRLPYDQSEPAGYLRADRTHPTYPSHEPSLSLGMDPHPTATGIHMVLQPAGSISRYDSGYRQNSPRSHVWPGRSASMGGKTFCTNCGSNTSSCRCNRVPQQLRYNQVQSQVLATCRNCRKRHAVSNLGRCEVCLSELQQQQLTPSQNSRYSGW